MKHTHFLISILLLFYTYSFGQHSFSPDVFIDPPNEYGPFTRWWWPGNDVDKEELQREVNVLVENRFAGVEIQPFTTGINPQSNRLEKIYSWDTPSYYSNLTAVLDEAAKTGLIVDLNGGSGWPIGGPFLRPDESILSLYMNDTLINADKYINLNIPEFYIDTITFWRNGVKTHNELDRSYYKLQTIVASRLVSDNGKKILDSQNLYEIPYNKNSKKINWKVPVKGKWYLMFVYTGPGAEKPLYIATKQTSWVSDPLNKKSLEKTYNYLFGSRTGLVEYYGKPIRAVFMDSKEFIVDRHVSNDFISYFKQKRGYDIAPYLFLNAIKGYDNAYSFGRDTIPKFVLSQNDWRIRYDYNKTISELFNERLYKYSSDWFEKRNMHQRSQSYGHRGDIIAASGLTSIPETEQLSGGSSDGLVKLVTSGAHLYNRPIISQESFVFASKAYMTTPQKIRVYANKSFSQGVNQIVYHGTAYKYKTEEYGDEGWYPWSTPFRTFNYSSNINETYRYWRYIKEINKFIARSQYALQTGKSKSDVLIYFPFIDFEASQVVLNPKDRVITGTFDENEPYFYNPENIDVKNPSTIQKWYINIWPYINKLEKLGVTWSFVNDVSLQVAKSRKYKIVIRDNEFSSLIVPDCPYMPVETAKALQILLNQKSDVLVIQDFPKIQPSYHDYHQKDIELNQIFDTIRKNNKVTFIMEPQELDNWFDNQEQSIRFNGQFDFIKQQERVMPDGSILKFYWNQTNMKRNFQLDISGKFKYSYWLSPEKSEIYENHSNVVNYELKPFEAIILYVTNHKDKIYGTTNYGNLLDVSNSSKTLNLLKWDIVVENIEKRNVGLFDFRTDSVLKFVSSDILYATTFELDKKDFNYFVLDLGKVYYSSEVYVNNTKVKDILWSPYTLDITNYLINGVNSIKIKVTPSDRNKFVGKGVNDNKYYAPVFKSRENSLMPAGLAGPVKIYME